MRTLTLASLALGTALAVSTVASPAHAALVLCGVTDGGAGDMDATVGVISLVCNTGTGTFTGTAEELNLPNFDLIRVRGTLTGSGAFDVSNAYNLGPWIGNGGELAFANGRFVGPLAGGEFLTVTATASTFSNNSAMAMPAIQANFSDTDVRFGMFAGPGTLTANIAWNAGAGTLDLGHTGDFQISVPEPATWALLLCGFGTAGAMLRRARRARPRPA